VKIYLLLIMLLACEVAEAQTRVTRIGVLFHDMERAESQAMKGVGAVLKQQGYQERKNFIFETRNAKGNPGALPSAASALLVKKVDLIFTTGTRATLAAIAAARGIPIVFVHGGDPVRSGLLTNPNDPARNVTGVAAYAAETTEKRLMLFKEILPALRKVYIFYDTNSQSSRDNFALAESAAKKLALVIGAYGIKSADELKTTLSNLQGETDAAIFQIADDLVENEAEFVFATARQKKLPTLFNEESWAIGGATAAYGPSYLEMGRLAGRLIDQIIKGNSPASLPIARATKFDLTINYRGANYIGLQFPKEILTKADKIIR